MPQNLFWSLFAKKLTGEASEDELKQLESLMKAHPDLLYSAQHLEDLWQLELKEDLLVSERAFERHTAYLKELGIAISSAGEMSSAGPAIRRFTWLFLIGSVLATGAVLYYLGLRKITTAAKVQSPQSEVYTKPGSKIRLLLPDSSTVWLNSGSKLKYGNQFGVLNRDVVLTGEAFFDVRKSHIPFVIHAQAVQIKVLGTAFNVRSYPSEKTTETSLIRGRVEIRLDKRPGELYVLKPNEKLVVKNEMSDEKTMTKADQAPIVLLSHLTVADDSTVRETSWVNNKLFFENEPFAELAARMERWYGVKINFSDHRLEQLRFRGVFEKETLEQALAALQMTGSFHFKIEKNEVTITN